MAVSHSATVSVDLKGLDDLSDRWSEAVSWVRGNRPEAKRTALSAAQILVGEIREAIMDSPATARQLPNQRTGGLARSYREEVKVTGGQWLIGAYSDLVYARIQDEGGRIFPSRMQRLAIPLTRKAAIRWPRDWPRGKLFRRGNALTERRGKQLINHYALAKSVKITGKKYTERAKTTAMPQIAKLIIRRLVAEMGA